MGRDGGRSNRRSPLNWYGFNPTSHLLALDGRSGSMLGFVFRCAVCAPEKTGQWARNPHFRFAGLRILAAMVKFKLKGY